MEIGGKRMGLIDWSGIIIYFALLIIIGYQTGKRIQDARDYNVAGERIIWPVMFATLAASIVGGGGSIGAAGNVFDNGLVFMFAFFGFGITTILTGYFIAPKLKNYNGAQSIGDVMEFHYGRATKYITGVLSVALCIGILGAQAVAIGAIFYVTLGTSIITGVVIGMGLVILYSTFGGLWAVIQTDALQFVVLGVIIPVSVFIGLFHIGGPVELVNKLPETYFTFLGDWKLGAFISLFITFLFGEALVPPYAQRAFSSKDSKHAQKGYVTTGIYLILFTFVVSILGLITYILYPNIEPDQALPTMLTTLLPTGLVGLAIAALLAIIMSTASSYLNATTVAFIQDVYIPLMKRSGKPINDKKTLMLGKIVTFITGVASAVFALSIPNIIDALTAAYTLWAPTVVFPLIVGVLFKVQNKYAGIGGILAGGLVTIFWSFFLGNPYGVTGLAPGLIANIITFLFIYFLTKNTKFEAALMFRRFNRR